MYSHQFPSHQSPLLSLPLELRNMIYTEVARSSVLNITLTSHKIRIHDQAISSSHIKYPSSTAESLSLVSHQIAQEFPAAIFHPTARNSNPIPIYFDDIYTLSDFKSNTPLYEPQVLRDYCCESVQHVMVRSPAWMGLPIPTEKFKGMRRFDVTAMATNLLNVEILKIALAWDGWRKDDGLSCASVWVFLLLE